MQSENTEQVIQVDKNNVFTKNTKKQKLTMVKLYDNMFSISYTLHTGELDKEKIEQQSNSFIKQNNLFK